MGSYIVKVGDKPYSFGTFMRTWKHLNAELGLPFEVTVERPSEVLEEVRKVIENATIPPGIVGVLLLFSSPWIYRSLNNGLEGSKTIQIAKHVILAAAVVTQLRRLGYALLGFRYSTVGAKLATTGDIVRLSGLVMGCLSDSGNPWLSSPLHKDMAAVFYRCERVALVLCLATTLSRTAAAWLLHGAKSYGMPFLRDMSFIPSFFLALRFTSLASRLAITARQKMDEVATGLPCDKMNFAERIHKPCAHLLADAPSNLKAFGIPIILLSCGTLMACIRFYDTLVYAFLLTSLPFRTTLPFWFHLSSYAFEVLALLWAIAVAPLQVSRALRDFEEQLNEERRRDPTVHLEVPPESKKMPSFCNILGVLL